MTSRNEKNIYNLSASSFFLFSFPAHFAHVPTDPSRLRGTHLNCQNLGMPIRLIIFHTPHTNHKSWVYMPGEHLSEHIVLVNIPLTQLDLTAHTLRHTQHTTKVLSVQGCGLFLHPAASCLMCMLTAVHPVWECTHYTSLVNHSSVCFVYDRYRSPTTENSAITSANTKSQPRNIGSPSQPCIGKLPHTET